jgi:hypothetical protein
MARWQVKPRWDLAALSPLVLYAVVAVTMAAAGSGLHLRTKPEHYTRLGTLPVNVSMKRIAL